MVPMHDLSVPGHPGTMTDLALLLFRHGYTAVERDRSRRAHGGADAYPSRLLGRRAAVLRGPAGVAAFYDESLVSRKGAVPPPLGHLLFGRGAVHTLDGEEHRGRRSLFLEALEDPHREALVHLAATRLLARAREWPGTDVVLHDELVLAYGRAVLEWSGVEVEEREAADLSRSLAAIVDGFGGAGRAYLSAWRARLAVDAWARRQVRRAREGRPVPPPGSLLARVADREDLDARTAAVELVNVLRPTVAVAWLGAFAAVALHRAPEDAAALATPSTDERHHAFAQEVRRTTPFAPVLAGRAVREAEVDGVRVRPGDVVVLDVWGSDTDPRRWADAPYFVPTRFAGGGPVPDHLVPQGGGPVEGHRCPGEPLTVRLLAETVRILATTGAEVRGDGQLDPTRIPTLPDHGVALRCPAS
jgi:fatty-acid peroxygenase